jgi:hypothetical protein
MARPTRRLAARAVIVVAGFAIGFIMHRSRLCFARAFREPFMTAEGDMTKAVILALAIGIPIAALLFQKKVIDPYLAIPPAFWIGSLVGGLIFGIGMVFAGGCASGSLWRMGEGHLKLWVTMFFFAWMGSVGQRGVQEARPHHHRRDQCRNLGDDQDRLPGLPARDVGQLGLDPACRRRPAAALVCAGALQRIHRKIHSFIRRPS